MSKSTSLNLDDITSGISVLAGPDSHSDGFALARRLATPIWVFDIDAGQVHCANAAACDFWQSETEEELCKRNMHADMSETVAQRLYQYQRDFLTNDYCFNEMWTLYPDGAPVSAMVHYRGYILPDGRMGMLCEVAGRTADEPDNLRSVEALLHTDVMVALYKRTGQPIYLNPAARNARNDYRQLLRDLFIDPADYAQLMMELDLSGSFRLVARAATSVGERWHDLSAKTCLDAVTGDHAILLTATDVSELKNARDKARYLANRDQLTGCYNRSFLQTYFAEKHQINDGSHHTLIYFDVDRFKLINDIHGHETGDTVLKTITARALASIRKNDVLVRLGGDEFVVVLEGHDENMDTFVEAERIRHAVSKPVAFATSRVDVAVSLGVTRFTAGSAVFTEVMREADLALYAAKSQGRGRSTIFDEKMGHAARARDALEIDLHAALHNHEFELYYQPRFDLKTKKVTSAEGLVRWHHPQKGIVMPDTFIPVCEETGIIDELGEQVLNLGYQTLCKWQATGQDRSVSINISPRQFNDDRLIHVLDQFARDPAFTPRRMEIEVTENVLIGDLEKIADKLRTITHMGYQIAIDDFGTGFSNLSYISQFPLHCIKIDRTFIDQLPASAPIVSLILTLGRQIGATVVAEGVETEAQLNWLIVNGCDQVQGYYLSRPVPLGDLQRVISSLDQRK